MPSFQPLKLFDLSLQLNGYPISRAKSELSKIKSIDDPDFGDYIKSQRKRILDYHLRNNDFYREFLGVDIADDWEHIPIMTKRHLQQPLSKRLSRGFNKRNIYINKTSGSSGDPFIFAKDKWSHALTWAVIMDRFSWYNLDFNRSKQARFYGIPLDPGGKFNERIKDFLSKRTRFSVFDLSDKAFERILKQFRTSRFEYINGYTSAIVQFAKFLERRRIVLKEICPTLKLCMVTSEMLFEQDRKLMERVFGVTVVNEYGASELDLIAIENRAGQWQVNHDTLFLEIVDESGKALPKGEEGRVVITSLYNKAHPFIRYDIGDIAALSENSSWKLPILKNLTGRTNDLAVLPSGKKAAGLTFYYITKTIIEDDGNVKEFIIEQTRLDEFEVKYVSERPLSKEEESVIQKEMVNYLEPGIRIRFQQQEMLDREKSGKLKQFSSVISQ